ncbi:Spore coat protein CotH [Paenibacillus algicola]|uniref:Spore coat protein CotH n=1 Tax=Paenibacillus algicola TaxID=2565926 RepID=A0A4P8XEU7_9BACL|nr:CotH kinase family protein [Paenibacillus algicola]QCT00887.1 Spore coat protein CotH [Paenibacillus algicola]
MELPVYRILIEDNKLAWLNKHIWSEQFVKARISYKGKEVPISLRYRGGHTREYPKRSYEIRTASATYHFNAEHDDPSLIRNALSFKLFETLKVPSPRTRHCLLYINQQRAGVYLQIEAVLPRFFRRRRIPVKSIIYAVNRHADFSHKESRGLSWFAGYRLIAGDEGERRRFVAFLQGMHEGSRAERAQFLEQHLHVEQYLRWLCGAVLTGNYDGFNQNYTIYEHGETRRYQMLPWDYEGTWGRNCYGKRVGADLVRITGYNKLTEQILSIPSYRRLYRSLLLHSMDTVFTPHKQLEQAGERFDAIAGELYKDKEYKWSRQEIQADLGVIYRYIQDRRGYIYSRLHQL